MNDRGQMMGGHDHWIAGAVIAVAIVVVVANQIMAATGWSPVYTAAAAGVGLILVGVFWLCARAGRRVGAWASEQWGGSDG